MDNSQGAVKRWVRRMSTRKKRKCSNGNGNVFEKTRMETLLRLATNMRRQAENGLANHYTVT